MKWWTGWIPLFLLPGLVIAWFPATWPRWVFMWTLSFSIYGACKWLTWRRTPATGVPLWKHLAYLLAWPGMDAAAFFEARPTARPAPAVSEWLLAAANAAIGLSLFSWSVHLSIETSHPYLLGWAGMVSLVLTLHFGLFHLLSCCWRSLGLDARPLMDWPAASVSVSEFWGRRWNRAFRDLTYRFLFRPLARHLGPRGGIAAGFVFSGLVHDLVISVPAQGGYGLPTVFFLIQGLAIFAEKSRWGKQLGLGAGWRGWLFTMAVLLGPVWLLFHPPFIRNIVLPFLKAVGEG